MAAKYSIITDISEIRNSAPGVDASLKMEQLQSFIHPSEKTLRNIIGNDVFREIDSLDQDTDLRNLAIGALSNLIMYNYKLWEAVNKRESNNHDTYKYELEMMRENYLDNYFSYLDDLFKELSLSENQFKSWKNNPLYKSVDLLLIKTTDEFDQFYRIDCSYYFFFSTIFIQQKVIDRHISAIDMRTTIDELLLRRIKTVTAQLTIAYALRQLDFLQLPKSIRNSRADGVSRSGSGEQSSVLALSDYLFAEAEKDLTNIIVEINRPEEGNIISDDNKNEEANKYYFL